MFDNYFKVAWRSLVRNKAFSVINLSGLALGLACSLLIMLWVQDERSVDGFHANGKYLYQVYERRHANGKVDAGYFTQGLLAEELKRQVPEIRYASPLEQRNRYMFAAGDRVYQMEGAFAGPDFFRMFSYPLLEGTPATALSTAGGIAVSRRMAEQFFGSPAAAMGKLIRYENSEDLQVTAVFENIPGRSSVRFDFLRNWEDYKKANSWVNSWGSASPATYVQLHPNADAEKTAAKIKGFLSRYLPREPGIVTELGLQPYREQYLHSTFRNGQVAGGRIEYVQLFTLVAVFILLIACINFMNLATARSSQRAKEVGVRKVIGAVRGSLVAQFAGEALLLTFLSILMALLLVLLLLPAFNTLTGKQLFLPLFQPAFWGALLVLLLVTGLLAGSYPAFFLSSLSPLRVLKGNLKTGKGPALFRKGLVVFQFSLSVILIIGMIVIYSQMHYVQSRHLGYDREHLVYIPLEGDLVRQYDLFREQALQLGGVQAVSAMRESPTVIGHHRDGISWAGKDPSQSVSFADAAVSYDFVKTMRLQLAAGRDFSRGYGADSTAYLINETAARKMGFDNPVGQLLYWGDRPGQVIGVLKDFHFNSMHQAIEPLFIRLEARPRWGTILVRTAAGKTKEALAGLEKVFKSLSPGLPFSYQFSDQEYARLYKSEQVVSTLANYFALLAVLISCLGLFGLALFSIGQRTREIGVRKVLGASVPRIVALLATGFLKPVMIAIVIASPVAWYVMDRWLQGFAYRTGMSWWMFAGAALLTVGIALATVSYQSIRAALMNPSKSLKAE